LALFTLHIYYNSIYIDNKKSHNNDNDDNDDDDDNDDKASSHKLTEQFSNESIIDE